MYLAQELDKVKWKQLKRAGEEAPHPNDYDYNRIIELTEALQRGENPLF